jgi:hypothetical protein
MNAKRSGGTVELLARVRQALEESSGIALAKRRALRDAQGLDVYDFQI